MDLAQRIDTAFEPISNAINAIVFFSIDVFGVSLPLVLIWLVLGATVFTVYFRFINLRGFAHAVELVTKPSNRRQNSGDNAPGEIPPFQALASALSGTVGLGNIASVPVAICLGGPGAIFWMILAGLLGMSSKFAECALAVKYRRFASDGRVLGGPMYYIEAAVGRKTNKSIGKAAGTAFALFTVGGSLSFFQVNQSYAQFSSVTGIEAPLIYGAIFCAFIAIVLLGGIKSIGRVTGILVPMMAGVYLMAAVVIIALHADALPGAVASIFKGAFGFEAAGGGLVGALINGVQRATYSSEAGVGSAAIAHAAVKTKEPVSEGYVALLEPFIDTVVVCTVTALVIITTGVHEPYLYIPRSDIVGIDLTSAAFEGVFSWYPVILLISVLFFAFSTLLAWAFYGAQAVAYLSNDNRQLDIAFKIGVSTLLSFGAVLSISAILNFIDAMLFAMCVPNMIALYILLPELKNDVKAYDQREQNDLS
ncbi:MAG: alanine/glycine:cation symporter family protein [Pseudomonadota bacterium]